jgi:hypothetical protein
MIYRPYRKTQLLKSGCGGSITGKYVIASYARTNRFVRETLWKKCGCNHGGAAKNGLQPFLG